MTVLISLDGLSAYCTLCKVWRNFHPSYLKGVTTAAVQVFYGCGHEVGEEKP